MYLLFKTFRNAYRKTQDPQKEVVCAMLYYLMAVFSLYEVVLTLWTACGSCWLHARAIGLLIQSYFWKKQWKKKSRGRQKHRRSEWDMLNTDCEFVLWMNITSEDRGMSCLDVTAIVPRLTHSQTEIHKLPVMRLSGYGSFLFFPRVELNLVGYGYRFK